MNRFLLILLVPALMLTGCKKNNLSSTITVVSDQVSQTGEVQASSTLQSLSVTCKKSNGDPDPLANWTLVSSEPWLKLSLSSDGSEAAISVSGIGNRSIYLVIDENASGSVTLYLNGRMTITITITVHVDGDDDCGDSSLDGIPGGGTPPLDATTYVGAFWKHDQTGERVIKINVGSNSANLGAWSASIAWYDSQWNPAKGDGVVLSAGGSTDPKIYQVNPNDAEKYQVPGVAKTVNGKVSSGKDIIFRVGLTKKFTAYNETYNPARYAVVVLTYGTPAKKQKIFLRQGEGPDYVMRPGDKNDFGDNVGGVDDRSFARKFSPYNLTDPNRNTLTNFVSMTTPATGLLEVGSGRFTDYPTQAGYFFMYNVSRRTFHPTTPVGTFTNWDWTDYGPSYWNAATSETCPPNYRRPKDGNNTGYNEAGPIAGSEMRQSLWLNPQAGNSVSNLDNAVWGYYADGYFDRRQLVANASGYSNTAVATPGANVAYIGQLFYNPIETSDSYNASLFFPAAGHRDYTYGALPSPPSTGYKGCYWSSSAISFRHTWAIALFKDEACMYTGTRSNGLSVRCVLQE